MPSVLEQPQIQTQSQNRQPRHPLVRLILRLSILVVVAAVISGAWYLARK